jgi:hypothetical protein
MPLSLLRSGIDIDSQTSLRHAPDFQSAIAFLWVPIGIRCCAKTAGGREIKI